MKRYVAGFNHLFRGLNLESTLFANKIMNFISLTVLATTVPLLFQALKTQANPTFMKRSHTLYRLFFTGLQLWIMG
jgi:hypothetical protein